MSEKVPAFDKNPYIGGQVKLALDWSLRKTNPELYDPNQAVIAWSDFFGTLYRDLHRQCGVSLAELQRQMYPLQEAMVTHINRYKWYAGKEEGIDLQVQDVAKQVEIVINPDSQQSVVQVQVIFPSIRPTDSGHILWQDFHPHSDGQPLPSSHIVQESTRLHPKQTSAA